MTAGIDTKTRVKDIVSTRGMEAAGAENIRVELGDNAKAVKAEGSLDAREIVSNNGLGSENGHEVSALFCSVEC